MTLISTTSAYRFRDRINVKHDTRDFVPIRVVRFGIEETRICNGVLLVVRAGRTSIGSATRSAELLERLDIPVLGAVLVAGDTAPTSDPSPRTHDSSGTGPTSWFTPFRRRPGAHRRVRAGRRA